MPSPSPPVHFSVIRPPEKINKWKTQLKLQTTNCSIHIAWSRHLSQAYVERWPYAIYISITVLYAKKKNATVRASWLRVQAERKLTQNCFFTDQGGTKTTQIYICRVYELHNSKLKLVWWSLTQQNVSHSQSMTCDWLFSDNSQVTNFNASSSWVMSTLKPSLPPAVGQLVQWLWGHSF